jgi:hypothetical protein
MPRRPDTLIIGSDFVSIRRDNPLGVTNDSISGDKELLVTPLVVARNCCLEIGSLLESSAQPMKNANLGRHYDLLPGRF